ncbi:hypothetical protein GCM10022252_00310 [Streptosporangium oxazolinicum]|uniref:DUF5753 domain-containing protein n=1 Tax=Streptosporangium oxazolinicum TaxID=909287 RepID=A0ABP8A7F3_9ACTN
MGQRTVDQTGEVRQFVEQPVTLRLPQSPDRHSDVAGIHAAMDGSFVILGFGAPDPDVVYVETQLSGLYQEQPAAIRRYNLVYEDLRAKALDARMSRNLLAKLAKEV